MLSDWLYTHSHTQHWNGHRNGANGKMREEKRNCDVEKFYEDEKGEATEKSTLETNSNPNGKYRI